MIQELDVTRNWDLCIIGGGATGLGAAVDAASRGLKTILLEQSDFAKGTSSRSTKLVHGGVRYLQQGNVKLVMEALHERGLLLRNAPHLVKNQQFVIPNYKWWEKPFYGIGLKIYDRMAGKLGLGPSETLSKKETLQLAPTLDPEGLRGSVVYHDGQFDDARLAINLAQTAASLGASLLNYFPVSGLLKSGEKISGVKAINQLTGKQYEILSKIVVNATGVFTDTILNMDNAAHENIVRPSQGIHLVVDKEFLPGDTAILIPRTDDGRVLFAVPWHQEIVLGTTDTPVSSISLEPVPLREEIDFILKHIGRYLSKDPQLSDVKSMFAGLRPLIKGKTKSTAALSRDHLILESESGMITIAGGKWTTYRRMGEDLVNMVVKKIEMPEKKCVTADLRIHGHDQPYNAVTHLPDDDIQLMEMISIAVKEEMCMTVDDFLSRRTRILLLDAKAALDAAPRVARMLTKVLCRDAVWESEQITIFRGIAENYLPTADI